MQHCHGEHCDEYFYRLVVYGETLITYVAHIPPHGGVSGDQRESDMFELSLYVLDGEATVTKGEGTPDDFEEKCVLRPHTAMNFPKGKPYGLWNEQDVPARAALSITPPPRGAKNPREMRELLEKRGRSVEPPEEMKAMAGPPGGLTLIGGLSVAVRNANRHRCLGPAVGPIEQIRTARIPYVRVLGLALANLVSY